MKKLFVKKNFSVQSLQVIQLANSILEEYQRLGYTLTLRQLYYQLVARDYIPNTVQSYKRIGNIVSDARLAGMMDWGMIEDRGREAYLPSSWTDPSEIVMDASKAFRVNRWEGQEYYVEVMVEKDALSGIIGPVCSDLHVRFTANKGYSSSSAMFEAGQRIRSALSVPGDATANAAVVIYLGDHDPSGIDMTRDIAERLNQFVDFEDSEEFIHVERIALNYAQVEEWRPPKNPAKDTDSRFESYRKMFGESSWELDAINPETLSRLVRNTIEKYIDPDIWNTVSKKEKEMRQQLVNFAKNYGKPTKRKKHEQ